jgi:hypothetical protein
MKAASLSQPWCWAVVDPIARKHIENRTWQPPLSMIGQTIAIHAAKSWDDKKQYLVHVDAQRVEARTPIGFLIYHGYEPPSRKESYASSCIVGVATIDRIVTKADTLPEDQRRWFFGPFGWVLTNVRRLEEPVPCGGKQGLWTVPAELEAGINAQLLRAA